MFLLSRYRFLQTASFLTTTSAVTSTTAGFQASSTAATNYSAAPFASTATCRMSSSSSNIGQQQLLTNPNLSIGLGTLDIAPAQVPTAISSAISLGYKRIDCAPVYFNEDVIGDAITKEIAEGNAKREELFIVSKLASPFHRKEHVKIGLQKTLTDLRLDYLDLYLVHWPQAFKYVDIDPTKRGYDNEDIDDSNNGLNIDLGVSIHETWEAMEELVEEGLVKSIGVSNFPVSLLHELMTKCQIPPSVNQVESHPYLQQTKLLKYCQKRGVHFQAYSPLGSPGYKEESDSRLLDDPILQKIADAHGVSVAQICIAWAISRGTSVVVKSATPSHQDTNIATLNVDIQLTESELEEIAGLERNYRFFRPEEWWEELGMAVFD